MSVQTDPLLTTALEKLLYLESRLDAAEAARAEAARESERHRIAAQAARQALSEWQRRTTDAEVEAESAQQEVSVLRSSLNEARQALNDHLTGGNLLERLREAEDRLVRYDREREAWLDRMVALGRLRSDGEGLDLGSFIAELRAELLALRRGETDRKRATVSDRHAAPDAEELLESIPSGPSQIDIEALLQRTRMSRPERTLASLCGRDLRNPSSAVRRRAAERLVEGRITVLTPVIVQLFATEPDAHVRLAFVQLMDASGDETARLALRQARNDKDPRVRAAVVEAVARTGENAGLDALDDQSPAVRRRGIALLPRTADALDALARALRDEDGSVRRVAALALSRRTGVEADALLQVAADSSDEEIRAVAREALARRGLEPVPPVAEEETLEAAPEPEPAESAEPTEPAEATPVEANPVLDERILEEIRTALRGRTIEELASRLDEEEGDIEVSIARLSASGALVWRGRKLYLP
jgi:HEAT repeat protein